MMRSCILRLKAPGLVVISLVTLTALLSGALSGCNKMYLVRPPDTNSTQPRTLAVRTIYPSSSVTNAPGDLQYLDPKLQQILERPLSVTKDPQNPLLSLPNAWVDYYLEHPVVLKDGRTYHMYFHGVGLGTSYKIGHATAPSPRGPWKSDPQPVLDTTIDSWDSVYVATPYVMKVDDKFFMWYSGFDGLTIRIGLAIADRPEGPFLKQPGNPFSYPDDPSLSVEGWVGSVQRVGERYYMWFGPEPQLHLAVADRPEGPWRVEEARMFASGGKGSWNEWGTMGEAGIIQNNGIFYMFMAGSPIVDADLASRLFPPGSSQPDPIVPFQIGMAVSNDAIHWRQSPHNPIIKRGEAGSYDYYRMSEVGVYFEGGVFYVYYTSIKPSERLPGGDETISLAMVTIL